MVVMVKIVRTSVVGDVQIRPAVIVVIGPDSLHSEVVIGIVHARCFRNILESAISTVTEQEIRFARQSPGTTLHHDAPEAAKLVVTAEFRQLVNVDKDVSGHKKINVPIAIKVAPGG